MKSRWTPGNWNAYVVMGATREERRARLSEVPEQWRSEVENHVRTYFGIKAAAQRRRAA